MNTKTAQNWYESILDSQKKMAESLNETAKKWSSNDQVNQTLENSSDFFKKWLDFQMDLVKNATPAGSANNAGESVQESMNQWKGFYENLFKSQFDSLTNMYNQNQNWFKQWSTGMQSNPWSNSFNTDVFSNWNKSVADMYQTMVANFNGNAGTKDVFSGLYSHTQSFLKFYELWNPVVKAMQSSGFTAENMRNLLSPDAYKQFMDSFFGFMPESVQGMFNENMNKMNQGWQQFGTQGMDMYRQLQSQWQQYIPQGGQVFSEALNNYNQMFSQMQNAFAPFSKLVAPNAFTKNTEAASAILDMMNRYQILNAQLQYMTYTTGIKAMDQMGMNIAGNLKEGKNYDSVQVLFKEWLDTSDKYFVELFETEAFSKLQAETSALSLRIKQAIDLQLEGMFKNVPLVPRSEMDELYKTVYELKKRVRTLEKELEGNVEVSEAKAETKAAPKKSSK